MSEDRSHAIVVIALLGNPFSPRYARARGGRTRPRALDFCALNVALYGPSNRLWALREQRVGDADRDGRSVAIGNSYVRWVADALVIDIDEVTGPFANPIRGRVTFRPACAPHTAQSLDDAGLHTWWPVAPAGRIDVELAAPSLRFTGHGYHDANAGDVALESSFSRWTWSRARVDDDRTFIAYDVTKRLGGRRSLAFEVESRRGVVVPMTGLNAVRLPTTRWRIDREARTDGSGAPMVLRELEDTPFYARALVETQLGRRRAVAVHETLSLERFERAWVRFLLPFRMGRE